MIDRQFQPIGARGTGRASAANQLDDHHLRQIESNTNRTESHQPHALVLLGFKGSPTTIPWTCASDTRNWLSHPPQAQENRVTQQFIDAVYMSYLSQYRTFYAHSATQTR